jgi:hypothetical protein
LILRQVERNIVEVRVFHRGFQYQREAVLLKLSVVFSESWYGWAVAAVGIISCFCCFQSVSSVARF